MFWENYDFLCKCLGKSANKVAEENGYSSGSVTAWKQGRIPKWATIEKFAKYFNVSVNYLLGKEEKPTNEGEPIHSNKEVITDSEHTILKKYNKLSDLGKNKAESYIDGLLENPSFCKSNVKFVAEMPVSVPPKVVKRKRHT